MTEPKTDLDTPPIRKANKDSNLTPPTDMGPAELTGEGEANDTVTNPDLVGDTAGDN